MRGTPSSTIDPTACSPQGVVETTLRPTNITACDAARAQPPHAAVPKGRLAVLAIPNIAKCTCNVFVLAAVLIVHLGFERERADAAQIGLAPT